MTDPTYDRKTINSIPAWELAFIISEILNDNAPIGWGQYIYLAEALITNGYKKAEES